MQNASQDCAPVGQEAGAFTPQLSYLIGSELILGFWLSGTSWPPRKRRSKFAKQAKKPYVVTKKGALVAGLEGLEGSLSI